MSLKQGADYLEEAILSISDEQRQTFNEERQSCERRFAQIV